MTARNRYTVGADVPDDEELRDSVGRIVDDAYVDAAVNAAREYVRPVSQDAAGRRTDAQLEAGQGQVRNE